MAGYENTYLSFAENDYQFFRSVYDNGIFGNPLASMGQNICERYLKHIVSEYAEVETAEEQQKKERVLRAHNLTPIMRFIQDDMGIAIPEEVENALERVNGFYFSTRYPGDDSFIASARDVAKANEAVERTRDFTLAICREIEHNTELEDMTQELEYDEDEWER